LYILAGDGVFSLYPSAATSAKVRGDDMKVAVFEPGEVFFEKLDGFENVFANSTFESGNLHSIARVEFTVSFGA
jgi:hypothetical protein